MLDIPPFQFFFFLPAGKGSRVAVWWRAKEQKGISLFGMSEMPIKAS